MNRNDAFLMRLDTHKNFLRIRIPEDEVIYPIASRTAERRLDAEPGKERFGTALEPLKTSTLPRAGSRLPSALAPLLLSTPTYI
jgi:hypothetical protein